jgi:hypothetical protein
MVFVLILDVYTPKTNLVSPETLGYTLPTRRDE